MQYNNNIYRHRKLKIIKLLGSDSVIYINTKKVDKTHDRIYPLVSYFDFDLGKYKIFEKYRNYFCRYVIKNDEFLLISEFKNHNLYIILNNYIKNIDNPRDSIWYKQLNDQLQKTGTARYRDHRFSSSDQIEDFFENYMRPIYESMKATGYNEQLPADLPKCFIGKDGELIKGMHGRHRFAIAKSLGVKRFPLQIIGVHEKWFDENVGTTLDLNALRRAYREVENKHQ